MFPDTASIPAQQDPSYSSAGTVVPADSEEYPTWDPRGWPQYIRQPPFDLASAPRTRQLTRDGQPESQTVVLLPSPEKLAAVAKRHSVPWRIPSEIKLHHSCTPSLRFADGLQPTGPTAAESAPNRRVTGN